jgi:hypothetical protein
LIIGLSFINPAQEIGTDPPFPAKVRRLKYMP